MLVFARLVSPAAVDVADDHAARAAMAEAEQAQEAGTGRALEGAGVGGAGAEVRHLGPGHGRSSMA
ncbi:hypothetical protein O7626_00005, partial [Micromonospora sp. WMMD1102]|uniref:hypothetical protein n=1 Tax=Micromonospora sp. WMMD1102 TaxID=3016105 RepID=UPI002414D87F